jgi:hypothetical protein
MGTPSYIRFVVDRHVMRRIPVYALVILGLSKIFFSVINLVNEGLRGEHNSGS